MGTPVGLVQPFMTRAATVKDETVLLLLAL